MIVEALAVAVVVWLLLNAVVRADQRLVVCGVDYARDTLTVVTMERTQEIAAFRVVSVMVGDTIEVWS